MQSLKIRFTNATKSLTKILEIYRWRKIYVTKLEEKSKQRLIKKTN